MPSLLRFATDAHQYDRSRVRWEEEGFGNSPTRLHFHYYINAYVPSLRRQTVLDIGSGTGHLYPLLKRKGAKTVIGIEPSRKNVRLSRQHYPQLRLYPTTVERAKVREHIQTAVIVMALEHMGDLQKVFRNIRTWLVPGGQLYAIVGSYRYHTSARFDYTVNRQRLPNGSTVVGVERPFGIIYDIIRPLSQYRRAARQAGLRFVRHIPLRPSPKLMRQKPKYRTYAQVPVNHLLILQRP